MMVQVGGQHGPFHGWTSEFDNITCTRMNSTEEPTLRASAFVVFNAVARATATGSYPNPFGSTLVTLQRLRTPDRVTPLHRSSTMANWADLNGIRRCHFGASLAATSTEVVR